MTTPESTVEAVELKPCPFCGGYATAEGFTPHGAQQERGTVACDNCGATIWISASKADAITAWNTRASLPAATEQQDFSRITLRENLQAILSMFRDAHPATILDKIMDAIPVGAYPFDPSPTDQAKLIDEMVEALDNVRPMLDDIIEREGLSEPCEADVLCGNSACEYAGCVMDKAVAISNAIARARNGSDRNG